MWFSLKVVAQLIIFLLSISIFTNANTLNMDLPTKSKKSDIFSIESIDKTPKEDSEKIKKTRRYPLDYTEALNLLEFNLLADKSPSSLFNYTYLSEESQNDGELNQEQVLKIMINYLKKSTIKLSQKELDGQAWPKLNSKTHLLFILNYDMDGFLALVKFIIDRKTGTVSLEEIAD